MVFIVPILILMAVGAAIFERNLYISIKPAIVFAEVIAVKNEPRENATDAFILHEGTKVFVLETVDNWKKIQLTDETEGWILSEAIKELIVKRFGKGITVIKGERGYLPQSFDVKTDCDIIVTIVTRLELLRIKDEIQKLDPLAFVYIQYIKEANGGILRHRKHH